ncbi:uncharacterized protein LY89DRAFT_718117 [Mollisia scopiformis]|uniref:Uncharacterized protein n=1 Tax=Mollisia scopiformis TaxID=149040 RepID=A0A194XCE0_MOLSC|nr:uncharacterized protein LY89DRAFT_718117 [Mollisia scopiformis]KUJ17417.1 hypothetical protein LY89DRAFT_718117 [Mollisia scopiformis]
MWLSQFQPGPGFCISARIKRIGLQMLNLGAWYLYSHGNTLQNHGAYNLLIFGLMFFPSNLMFGLLYVWFELASSQERKTKSQKRFWKQFLGAVAIFGVLFFHLSNAKREQLKYGFFGDEIPCSAKERKSGSCDSCQWQETTPWFDLLPFRQNIFTGPMTCPADESFSARFEEDRLIVEGCENTQTEIKSYFNDSVIARNNGPIYSLLPRTETWGLAMKNDSLNRPYNGFQDTVLQAVELNTFPYFQETKISASIDDILVHCGTALPKLVYRIQPSFKNNTTSTPNNSSTEEDKRLNIIILFIDAMSRAHFHRRLPLTQHALELLTGSPSSTSTLYPLTRYHSIGINTTPNTRALWAGLPTSSLTTSFLPIWEQFQSHGYTSARVDPMCQDWTAYYDAGTFPSSSPSSSFISQKIAHEHIAFSCLPPHLPIGKDNAGNFAGPASIKARCFSDTHIGHHVLDWTESFISSYQSPSPRTPYFLNAAFMEAHEGSSEVLRTLDARLATFFSPTTSAVNWNSTAVVMVSDHGALMGLNNAFFENGRVEAKNPFAAFVLPDWFMGQEDREDRFRGAVGRLVTPFDVYETVRGIGGVRGGGERSGGGVDLLRDGVGDRSCGEAGIAEEFCRCR